MSPIRIVDLTLMAVGLLAMFGCAASTPAAAGSDLVVTRGALGRRVTLSGELVAVRSDVLSVPRTPAFQLTVRWMAESGIAVQAGEPVLEFDASGLAREWEQLKAAGRRQEHELAHRQAEDAIAAAALDFAWKRAQIALAKAEVLAAVPEDAVGRRVHQERQLARARALSEQSSAEQNRRAQQQTAALEVEIRRIGLEQQAATALASHDAIAALTLRAPRAGILLIGMHPWQGRRLEVGDEVWPGVVVAELPDLGAMRVEAVLFDVDDGRIAAGMPAECVLDAIVDRRYSCRVVSVGVIASEPSRASLRRRFVVAVALEETDPERMRPGMSVRVLVDAGASPDGLLAPRAGLDLDGPVPQARLPGGGRVPLELDGCDAQVCAVRGGLAAGDRLEGALR